MSDGVLVDQVRAPNCSNNQVGMIDQGQVIQI